MRETKLIQITFLTALAPVFWGTTYIVTTQMLPPDRPFIAAVMRVLPAGVILLFLNRQFPSKGFMLKVLLLSFLNIACFQALLFVAAYNLPGGIAAVIGSVQPLIIMLLIRIFERIKPDATAFAASFAAVIGMGMLLIKPDSSWNVAGLSAAFGGAFSMALGTYLTAKWKSGVSNLTFTGWQLFFGGLMLLPVAFSAESFPAVLVLRNYAGYVYLAFFGSLVAYSLWFQGISALSPVAVSVLGLLSPVTAVTVGWIFLKESMSMVQSAGFVTVLACIVIVQMSARKGRK